MLLFLILQEQSIYREVNGEEDTSIRVSYDTSSKLLTITPMTTKGTKCYLYFDEVKTLSNEILAGKNIQTRSDFSTVLSTNTNGIIFEEEIRDGTTYYWRGDVDNNYLVFADKYWRIIRINEEGTLRIIYSGEKSEVDAAGKETVLANGYNDGSTQYTQTQINAFNNSYNASEYVGYRYTSGSQRPSSTSTGTNSTIKGILETWYSNNLQSYDSKIASSSAGFCNDRNLRSTEGSWVSTGRAQYYAAYERLITNKTPTFECSNSNDLYITKVGLITVDEVAYAGGATNNNYGYYLYTGNYYWTMTPAYFNSNDARVFRVLGGINYGFVHDARGIRPVISLRAINTITGSGTINDPYVVI